MAAITSGQQKYGLFIKGRALLLFLIFLAAIVLFIIAGSHYDSTTHFSATNHSALTIAGAPGEVVSITINAGSSVSGYWATDGLQLSLQTPSNFSTTVVAPHDREWSDEIDTDLDNPDSDMLLNGTFTIPTNLGDNETFTGQISGDVDFPNDAGFAFTEAQATINVPVQLVLLNATTFFLTTTFPLYAITGLGALALLLLPAVFRMIDVRRKPAYPAL